MELGQKPMRSKENALIILASTPNYREAAKQLNIAVPTIYSWLRDPEFASKVEETRNEIVSDAIAKMKGYAVKAVETLANLMDDESAHVRRAASNDILNHVGRFMELKEFEQRLINLERQSTRTK